MPIEIKLNGEHVGILGPDFDQMLIPGIKTTITWSGDDKSNTALINGERPKQSILYLKTPGSEGTVEVDTPIETNLFPDKEVIVVNYLQAKRI